LLPHSPAAIGMAARTMMETMVRKLIPESANFESF
jgi:hypothetical protein